MKSKDGESLMSGAAEARLRGLVASWKELVVELMGMSMIAEAGQLTESKNQLEVVIDELSSVPQEATCLAQREDKVELRFVPRLTLDFDGVVHSYTSGWAGDACIIPDPPVAGAFDFIAEAVDRGYEVSIFSTRSHVDGAREAMSRWMLVHGLPRELVDKLVFPTKKPNGILMTDDRGSQFRGRFPSFEYIDSFKPWNKGGQSDV